jgi:hypothetical protein
MLRHLNNQEMLAITDTWSTNPDARATFLSIPDIAPLHPKVVKVTAELLAIQPAPDASSDAVKKLVATAARADIEHDALVRAVSAGVEAEHAYCLAAKPPQLARAEQAEKVHAKLFPTGMAIVNVSLLAEAGNAARVAALLEHDPSIADFLDAIPFRDDQTALDLTRRWLAIGRKLGRLEHERSVLTAKGNIKPVELVAISGVRARWLRLVAQVLSALELSDAPAETIEIIRGPVLLASERAGKRYAEAAAAGPAVEPVEAGTVNDDAAATVVMSA